MNKSERSKVRTGKILVCTFFIVLFSVTVTGFYDYYVSTEGNDNDPGTQGKPFKTIQKAANTVKPGDTVHIASGTYAERIEIMTSGTGGNQIIFQGERGPTGEFLTIIDGGEPAAGWTVYEEGSDYKVWKTTSLPSYTPGNMVWGEKQVPQHRLDELYDRWTILKSSLDHTMGTHTIIDNQQVYFWRTFDAVWTLENNIAYVRFKDKSLNPNNENLRWSGTYRGGTADDKKASFNALPPKEGTVLYLVGKDYNTFRNLKIQGASQPVLLRGSDHNIVEDCLIQNGVDRVLLQDGAANNIVRNSEITMNVAGSDEPGGWKSTHPQKYLFYAYYKRAVSEIGTSEDRNFLISQAGPGNQFYGNHIHGGLFAFSIYSTDDLKIYDNNIHGHSSGSILFGPSMSAEIFDNIIGDSGAWIFRWGFYNGNKRTVYVYRNRFYQPEGLRAEHMYVAVSDSYLQAEKPNPNDRMFFYHNSYLGDGPVLTSARNTDEIAATKYYYFFNNIFSTGGTMNSVNKNHVGGYSNNLHDSEFWVSSEREFSIPEDSQARNAGIDLSRAFTANGKSFAALPGMEPGYGGADGKPDLGAIQKDQQSVALPVTESGTSDTNGNGKVDITDLILVAKTFGRMNYHGPADVDQDGKVTIQDLIIVARNFGKVYG